MPHRAVIPAIAFLVASLLLGRTIAAAQMPGSMMPQPGSSMMGQMMGPMMMEMMQDPQAMRAMADACMGMMQDPETLKTMQEMMRSPQMQQMMEEMFRQMPRR